MTGMYRNAFLLALLLAVSAIVLATARSADAARTLAPRAGASSPEIVTISRAGGELQSIALRNPPGLLGVPAGVATCPGPRAERGTCPAASQVGTVSIGLGPGIIPVFSEGGVYLTGPYEGAPFGLAVSVPVLGGLLDLGKVIVRASLDIDPRTAVLSVHSDPLPQALGGIPLLIRTIHLDLDRKGFIVNPTSCRRGSIETSVTSTTGMVTSVKSPFQASDCAGLAFAPKLRLQLGGQANRGGHPRLKAVLRMPAGDANLRRLALSLPATELVDSSHVRAPCTRKELSAGGCPSASAIGFARAFTPLLRTPIAGRVYLLSSGRPLPDLLVALHGRLDLDLLGRIDSVDGGLRVYFPALPDVPLTKFTLALDGGRTGLLQNGVGLCDEARVAKVRAVGQNGKTLHEQVELQTGCARTAP